ncbi:MAG: FliI/YscN family ATPase [Pseudomonadota bacterium]
MTPSLEMDQLATSNQLPNSRMAPYLDAIKTGINACQLHREIGAVIEVTASRIVTTLTDVFVGERCILRIPGRITNLDAQVVALDKGSAILSPLQAIDGISSNTQVIGTGEACKIHVGPQLTGRVLDGLGRPMDGLPIDTEVMQRVDIVPKATNALDFAVIDETFETGIKNIDGFNTVGHGQRMAIFGEAGAGKSTLLSMLARHSQTDVVVLAMIGERSREVNEFLERQLPKHVRERCVVVVATSDRPAMERIMAAQVSATIAEQYRAQGKQVLLLFDSVTRYARALREVGLSAGENAVRSGFTPSVYAELPRLIERSGKTASGAITAFYTVLVENNGVNDPIAEEIASLTDGHLILDSELARSGIYPAINVLRSKSRLMNEIADSEHNSSANRLRRLMAKYQDMELLIQMGEYVSGTDQIADDAVNVHQPLQEFLIQDANIHIEVHSTIEAMKALSDDEA